MKKLSPIDDVCNRFILPIVIYPWGCYEFIHKGGYVDLDIVIQLFIKKCNLYIVDISKLSKIEHTHNDYPRESHSYYDMWLQNMDWKVSHTIAFVNIYPRVLTCKDHDGE